MTHQKNFSLVHQTSGVWVQLSLRKFAPVQLYELLWRAHTQRVWRIKAVLPEGQSLRTLHSSRRSHYSHRRTRPSILYEHWSLSACSARSRRFFLPGHWASGSGYTSGRHNRQYACRTAGCSSNWGPPRLAGHTTHLPCM